MARPVLSKAYRDFEVKAIDAETRRFTGLASTWSMDLDGDVIERGAFKRSLGIWRSSPKPYIPLLDLHNQNTILAAFGKLEAAEETEVGLETEFSVVESPMGDEYFARIAGGYCTALSIGYTIVDASREEREIAGETVPVRVLREVRLWEISAVIWGANPEALIDVAAAKALISPARSRSLTTEEIEGLKALRSQLDELLPVPGLAPMDPERIRLEQLAREIQASSIRSI